MKKRSTYLKRVLKKYKPQLTFYWEPIAETRTVPFPKIVQQDMKRLESVSMLLHQHFSKKLDELWKDIKKRAC